MYDSPKMFCPIVLLHSLEKHIEKVIGEWLQFHLISNNFIYPNQLGEIKQCLTIDIGIFLTYLIQSEWIKNLQTSTLAFNVAQFFLSLNHQLLPIILDKAGFDQKISSFFSDYLIGRKTQYLWNNFISPLFCVNIDIGQGFALSPILFALHLSSIVHIFKKRVKNSSLISF